MGSQEHSWKQKTIWALVSKQPSHLEQNKLPVNMEKRFQVGLEKHRPFWGKETGCTSNPHREPFLCSGAMKGGSVSSRVLPQQCSYAWDVLSASSASSGLWQKSSKTVNCEHTQGPLADEDGWGGPSTARVADPDFRQDEWRPHLPSRSDGPHFCR